MSQRKKPKPRRAKGEGGITYDEKRKLYIGSISYLDEHNKRQRPKVTARTKEALVEKLDALKAKHRHGISVLPTERLTLAVFLDRWLTEVVAPTKKPTTHASYSQIVRLYITPDLGRLLLKEITPDKAPRAQAWLNSLSRQDLGARTVRYTRDVLRIALNKAVRWGLAPCNIATLIEPPPLPHTEHKVLTQEQAVRFLEAVRGDRLEALYTVALTLGLRRGEAVGLRWQDVDLDKGLLHITGQLVRVMGGGGLIRQDAKTSGSHRTIVLPRSCLAALKRRRVLQKEEALANRPTWQDTGYVFTTKHGTPFEPRNINKYLERILEAAGLPQMGVHALRHSAATLLHAMGESLVDISRLLGHSSTTITANLYTHITDPAKKRMADTIDDLYGTGTED